MNPECGRWYSAGSHLATPLCVGIKTKKKTKKRSFWNPPGDKTYLTLCSGAILVIMQSLTKLLEVVSETTKSYNFALFLETL